MQRIFIENFGPINRFEADVKDVMLLIGPQASGKSTLSKSIFLFKSIKDELSKFILDVTNEQLEQPINEFSKHLRNRFVDCFGTTKHMKPFTLKYYYSNQKEMTFSLNPQNLVDAKFNSNILDDMNVIFKRCVIMMKVYQEVKLAM